MKTEVTAEPGRKHSVPPHTRNLAKRSAPWLCAACLGLTACHTRYDIVLRNGAHITAVGKPVYDKDNSVYRYRDAKGDMHTVSVLRVREIDARSIFNHGSSDNQGFISH